MTHLDLTEALRVGTERLRLAGHEPADQLAGAVLLGAGPVIAAEVERLVRERIAAEQLMAPTYDVACRAYFARIARGGAA